MSSLKMNLVLTGAVIMTQRSLKVLQILFSRSKHVSLKCDDVF